MIKLLNDVYPSMRSIIPYSYMPFCYNDIWFALSNNQYDEKAYKIYDLKTKVLNDGVLPISYWTGERRFNGVAMPCNRVELPCDRNDFNYYSWYDLVHQEEGHVPNHNLFMSNGTNWRRNSLGGIPIFELLEPGVFSTSGHTMITMSKRKLKSLNTNGRKDCVQCGSTLTTIKGMGPAFNYCKKCEG